MATFKRINCQMSFSCFEVDIFEFYFSFFKQKKEVHLLQEIKLTKILFFSYFETLIIFL